jgi:hypothetical protein
VPRHLATTSGGAAGANSSQSLVTDVNINNGWTIIGVTVTEDTVAATPDSDTTNGTWSTQYSIASSSGTAATSMAIGAQWKTVTATAAQTYNTTTSAARDFCLQWIQMYEAERTVQVGS